MSTSSDPRGRGHTHATDPAYLRYQYGDAERLEIRLDTHRRYSERPDDMESWLIEQIDARPSDLIVDVGCGPGWLHGRLTARARSLLAFDLSPGMAEAARRQALERSLPVAVAVADAQALPLPDASCDRVLASHMLYHVPDIEQALREMRRVLRAGGRAVMSTNAADNCARLHDLHVQAARSLGFTPIAATAMRFSLDDLAVVRSVFPSARRIVRPNAFLFREVEPVLRYYASGWVNAIAEYRVDGAHRPPLIAALRERIEAILASEGVFRVPKDAGCFVAER